MADLLGLQRHHARQCSGPGQRRRPGQRGRLPVHLADQRRGAARRAGRRRVRASRGPLDPCRGADLPQCRGLGDRRPAGRGGGHRDRRGGRAGRRRDGHRGRGRREHDHGRRRFLRARPVGRHIHAAGGGVRLRARRAVGDRAGQWRRPARHRPRPAAAWRRHRRGALRRRRPRRGRRGVRQRCAAVVGGHRRDRFVHCGWSAGGCVHGRGGRGRAPARDGVGGGVRRGGGAPGGHAAAVRRRRAGRRRWGTGGLPAGQRCRRHRAALVAAAGPARVRHARDQRRRPGPGDLRRRGGRRRRGADEPGLHRHLGHGTRVGYGCSNGTPGG